MVLYWFCITCYFLTRLFCANYLTLSNSFIEVCCHALFILQLCYALCIIFGYFRMKCKDTNIFIRTIFSFSYVDIYMARLSSYLKINITKFIFFEIAVNIAILGLKEVI